MRGRSMEGAIIRLKEEVEGVREKHTLGDFSRHYLAFDRVWFPEVLWRLRDKKVKRDLYRAIKDYFRGRWVELRGGGMWKLAEWVNRGCPKGSRASGMEVGV